MSRLFILAPALLLSACVVPIVVPVPLPANSGECSNEGLEHYVGQPASQQLGAEMLRTSGARTLQWINPGMAVTMDFLADRLRVTLDRNGRVESARCG